MSKEHEEKGFSTADLVAAAEAPAAQRSAPRADDRLDADHRLDADRRLDTNPADTQYEERRVQEDPRVAEVRPQDQHVQAEPLAALFPPEVASDFNSRWDAVQIGFVDDPGEAVRKADELVAQVMKSLAESFANERDRIEGQLGQTNSESTENMRVALRRYRSFFQRLLSL
jgi:hypothetical protein